MTCSDEVVCKKCAEFFQTQLHLEHFSHNLAALIDCFHCDICSCNVCAQEELDLSTAFVVLTHTMQCSLFGDVEPCKCWDCRHATVQFLANNNSNFSPAVKTACANCQALQQCRPFVVFVVHRLMAWLQHLGATACACAVCQKTGVEVFTQNVAPVKLAHNLAIALAHIERDGCGCEQCLAVQQRDAVLSSQNYVKNCNTSNTADSDSSSSEEHSSAADDTSSVASLEAASPSVAKKKKLDNGAVFCIPCNLMLANKLRLKQHMSQVHRKKFICEKCGWRFGRSIRLRNHELVCTGVAPRRGKLCRVPSGELCRCSICDFSVFEKYKPQLTDHLMEKYNNNLTHETTTRH